MFEAIRIILTAYTASFRVPHFVGYQLSLPVPPLSTVYGLISAAVGEWVTPDKVEWLAYRCEYTGRSMDTEAIWTVERRKFHESAQFETRNIIQREFLALPRLTLYLPPEWADVFRCPRYALLLGRTQDVATVEEVRPTTLEPTPEGEVSGVLLPFELLARGNVSAWLQNLPVAFTDEPSRRPVRTHIFGVVDAHRPGALRDAKGWLVRDTQSGLVLPLFRWEWVLHGVA
jgi:CRISPR-associated protein Cas5t